MTASDEGTGEATDAGGEPVDELLRLLAAAPPVSPGLAAGTEIAGRYTIAGRLGRGGMGVVYSAYDRELERRVALKLHRADADPRAAARTLREARAMARLAHPNVLAVHEVGEHEGRLFIVVEWVDGVDLRAWLADAPRTPAAILAVFVAAGEGLAAAHDAGLVHRDFKPANVLIAVDGRVRVADFGLARAAGPRRERAAATSEADDEGAAVTREVAGTPGYMAPEQAAGATIDARSDQFSFCVALREALGADVARLPAAVGRAIRRGLSERPGDRFADMRALLGELRPERVQRRRRRALLGGLLVAVAGSSVTVGALVVPAGGPSCAPAAWQAAEIWPGARRSALARRFAGLTGPYAREAWPRVERALHAYADELAAAATTACRDTHVHGVASTALLDRRMACLTRARRAFAARVTALDGVTAETLEQAVPLATGLPDLSRCADGERQPTRAVDPARVADVEEGLAAAQARMVAGDPRGAAEAAEALAAEVDALAEPGLVADQRRTAGEAWKAAYATPEARARLEEGYLAARTAGDEARAARLSLSLAALHAEHAAPREALTWVRVAGGELGRGGGDRRTGVELLLIEGAARAGLGELPAALERYAAAEELLARQGSARPEDLGRVLSHRGVALELLGRFAEAVTVQERSLAAVREALGEHHPSCVRALTLIGTALAGAGRLDEAEARYREAIALATEIFGGDHAALAVPLADLAVLEGTRGRLAAAIELLTRTLAIHEAQPEPDPSEVAATLAMLGEYHSASGRAGEGLALLDRALALEVATFGEAHARVAECRMRRAQVLADTGAVAAARADQLAAAAALERTLGPDSPLLADSLMLAGDNSRTLGEVAQGEALLRRSLAVWARVDPDNPQAMHAATSLGDLLVSDGRADEALAWLERAVRVREQEQGAPWRLAESRWQLARALWAVGGREAQARAQAEAALAALTATPDPLAPARREEVAAWLRVRQGDHDARRAGAR
jgi:tetratricopeptide (TPR) repeat protein/predicted Ser/Thr protein kinase